MDDFDAYLEHIASLQDSTEHKRYMAGSAACFQEWCDKQQERLQGQPESEPVSAREAHVGAWGRR